MIFEGIPTALLGRYNLLEAKSTGGVIRANLPDEPLDPHFGECFSRLFAILFKLAVNFANILKGTAAKKKNDCCLDPVAWRFVRRAPH
jgi:hypothetical protein